MKQYRITKYDPQYRVDGVYERFEWSSPSDVGSVFEDGLLTQAECSRVLNSYVACALAVMDKAGVAFLKVTDLEINRGEDSWAEGQVLSLQKAGPVIRSCLKEDCWCRLEAEDAFVHCGCDMYMYVGCDLGMEEVRAISTANGLFAEDFPSPYREEEEEPAIHPFVFSTDSQAPAATRISGCFLAFEKQSRVTSLAPYTDALDQICVVPFCISEKFLRTLPYNERRYISWRNRYADIRLKMDFDTFIHATREEQMRLCRENLLCSLQVVKDRCDKKKQRFDLEALLKDLFAD